MRKIARFSRLSADGNAFSRISRAYGRQIVREINTEEAFCWSWMQMLRPAGNIYDTMTPNVRVYRSEKDT
jgi:hypothetical protein